MFTKLIKNEQYSCGELYNCCSCGGGDDGSCGCAYCFDCHACEACRGDDVSVECELISK